MDSVRLVEAIVRHTTAFIAQISTAAGLRAPLAHIADQVFLDLSRELEAQGVSRKVVASMFGMALRGYQRKVQRLTESTTSRGKTLWEALVEHLDTHGPSLRVDLDRRFAPDGEEHVAAVLRDLTESGIVYCTGRGESAVYGLSSAQDRERILLRSSGERLKVAAWYTVYQKPQAFLSLRAAVGAIDREMGDSLLRALKELVGEGLVEVSVPWISGDPPADAVFSSRRFLVPVGIESGWEVAVFDHYRAVLDAVAMKLRLRVEDPQAARYVGGATLVFDLHAEHPLYNEALGLLERVRSEVNEVWDRVSAHNRQHPAPPEALVPMTFYFGQNVEISTRELTHE